MSHQRSGDSEFDELFVFPWMVVVANIPTIEKDGKFSGESGGKKLKDEWIKQGYNVIKVHPLQGDQAVVEFGKEWYGFKHAMMFVNALEMDKHGRENKDDKLYAWFAGEEDYNANSLVGEHLRKHGDLKTLSAIQKEDDVKRAKRLSSLKTLIEENSKKIEELQEQVRRTAFRRITEYVMGKKHNSDLKQMQDKADEQLRKITIEQ